MEYPEGTDLSAIDPNIKIVIEGSEPEAPSDEYDKVAIFSERNMFHPIRGSVSEGYNIVNKAYAEEWIKHPAVRIATPEELAKEYS